MSLHEALENPEEIQRRKLEHKRRVWDAIKAKSPEHAEFIESVTQVFGRPERVLHKVEGKVFDSLLRN